MRRKVGARVRLCVRAGGCGVWVGAGGVSQPTISRFHSAQNDEGTQAPISLSPTKSDLVQHQVITSKNYRRTSFHRERCVGTLGPMLQLIRHSPCISLCAWKARARKFEYISVYVSVDEGLVVFVWDGSFSDAQFGTVAPFIILY